MSYSLTDFTALELQDLMDESIQSVQRHRDEIDIIDKNFEDEEPMRDVLLRKRNRKITTITQFQVMLLTALQEVKQRETINAN